MILSDLSTRELMQRLQAPGISLRTGPFVYSIRSSLGRVAEGLRRLYADFLVLDDPSFADFHVSVLPQQGLRRWVLPEATFSLDGVFNYEPFPRHMATAFLEWGLNCCIFHNVQSYLTLHGAVVERGGKATIILGDSGAGKSTLCAALVADGWRLLSDELTLIDPATLKIAPLARPISLKNNSVDLIRSRWPQAVFGPASHGVRKGTVVHVRPPKESVQRAQETAMPWRVLFVQYDPLQATPKFTELAPAPAHLRITRHAFNYGILGQQGFETLSRLLTHIKTFEFCYGNLDAALTSLASDDFLLD